MMLENAGARLPRGVVSVLLLGAATLLVAGCGKDDKKDAARPPLEVTALTIVAARRARHVRLRRADAELAGGQHRGARVGLPRQARLHRRRRRQGGPGAVPDGPEAVPGAGRRRGGRAAAQPGGARSRAGEPRAHQAARAAERAVAEGPGRRAGAIRAGGGGRRAVEGAARIGEARPLVHDDLVARRRRSAASRRWPTARTSIRRTASSPRSRC